jgi:hypothetical protein
MTTNKPFELGKASKETRQFGTDLPDSVGQKHGDRTL